LINQERLRKRYLVIVATSTPDDRFPSTAARVQHAIGATHAAAFDLAAACSGFVYVTAVGSQWIETGCCQNALVVGVDVFSRIVDWRDRRTAVLFGDGAGAVLLRRTGKPYPCYLSLGADGSGGELLCAPMGGTVSMNGNISLASESFRLFCRKRFKPCVSRLTTWR